MSSSGDSGPGAGATRDRLGRKLTGKRRGNKPERESVLVLLSASPLRFVREPDGVYSHHSESWRLPAATSCYLLSPIKCHFLPPPLPILPSLPLIYLLLPSSSSSCLHSGLPLCTVDFCSFNSLHSPAGSQRIGISGMRCQEIGAVFWWLAPSEPQEDDSGSGAK